MAKQQSTKSKNQKTTTPQYPAAKSATPTDWKNGWLPIALVLGVTLLAFLPTFQAEFVNWDDPNNIYENKLLNAFTFDNIVKIFTTDVIGGYNPLSIFTFAIEKALFGKENWSAAIHANNLILHLVCVFLVWRMATELGLSRFGAFAVALLFGIHPMRVESVAWATERKDVLFGAFYFAALLQYIKYLKSEDYRFSNRHLLIAFGLFMLSLFSKVQAVSLPLSMLAIDLYFRRSQIAEGIGGWVKLGLEKAHFFAGSLLFGSLNIYFLTQAKTITETSTKITYSGFDRVWIAGHSYFVYVAKFFFPYELNPIYAYPRTLPTYFYATTLLFVASVAAAIWAYRKGWTMVVFGWLFFFVNFIFVSQLVGAGQGFMADRFTYIAYLGFWLMAAAYVFGANLKSKNGDNLLTINSLQNTSLPKYALAAYAVLCFFMTYRQTESWQTSDKLWSHSIESNPNALTPFLNHAIQARDKKDFKTALYDLDRALEMEDDEGGYLSRGKTYFDMGNSERAIHDYTQAIKMKQDVAEFWANRGSAYGSLGKLDSAMADLTKAIEIDSLHVNALMNRGNVHAGLKNYEASIRDLSVARREDPENLDVISNRLLTYREMGKFDLALADAEAYLLLKKDNPAVWADRGFMKKQLGRCAEAIPDFDETIRLKTAQIGVFIERADCHRQLGNLPAMRADVESAKKMGAPVNQIPPALLQ